MIRDRKAFTLVEMVVTLVLISIVAFAVSHIFMEGFRSYILNRNIIDLRSELRTALKRMVFEIRQAEAITRSVLGTDINIIVDLDGDGETEVVRYYVDSTYIRHQIDGSPNPGNIVLGNVSSASFSDYPLVLTTTRIITLDITLTKMDDSVRIRTRVRPRCMYLAPIGPIP